MARHDRWHWDRRWLVSQRCDNLGFSLAELMIVLVVISIVALLVLPGADDQTTRVREAARLLVADLEYAQLRSIGNGADPCVVVFEIDDKRYYVARASDPSTAIDDPGSSRVLMTHFGEGRARFLDGVVFDNLSVGGDSQLGFSI